MLCSRLIQTSPVTSWIHKHSLMSYGNRTHTAARQSNLVINWLLGATDQDRWNLLTFFIISTHILLGLISPGSTEADIEWSRHLNIHLVASYVRNMCAKNYWSLVIMLQVTVNNVGKVFSCFFCIFQCTFCSVFFTEVVQKQTIGWGEKLNGHLMASCVRNIGTKNYKNLIIFVQVGIENVRDVFLRHSVVGSLGREQKCQVSAVTQSFSDQSHLQRTTVESSFASKRGNELALPPVK